MRELGSAGRQALQHPGGVRLTDFLPPSAIQLELTATDKDEALEELISLLPINETDRRISLATLRQRETVGSTGVGMGVAIPHCRSTTFSKLTVAFGRSTKGIAFQAPRRLLEAESPAEVRTILSEAAS
jgi:mannitol/fructose-specific phosphotransferase system IIA component (Ntr-type)